jgi:hypothetical protein
MSSGALVYPSSGCQCSDQRRSPDRQLTGKSAGNLTGNAPSDPGSYPEKESNDHTSPDRDEAIAADLDALIV